MDITPLDAHDEAALAEWHAAYEAADVFERPHAAPWRLPEMRADLTHRRTGESMAPWVGTDDGVVVCCGLLVLPLKDNLQLALVRVWTPPDHRRRGYGGAMLAHLEAEAAKAGRTRLASDAHTPYDGPENGAGHPDADFAYRRGWTFDMCDIVRVVPLPVDVELLEGLVAESAPHHTDYTLLQFSGAVPQEIVVGFGELVGSLMVEAPMGELELEAEVLDEERIRTDEAALEAAGRTKYTTVALDRDSTPVAYSELVVPHHDPGPVFQWGTLVHPDHRGHRLGMATKAANLAWVQREAPDRNRVYTMNAEVNAQMIAINQTLGFEAVERHVALLKRQD
ncbi:MAG: GNAT family N-acetyltransferase [Nocardioides sp.]